jgi:hypothetical protein
MSSLAEAFIGSMIAQGLYDTFFDIPEYDGGNPSVSVGDYSGAESATIESNYGTQDVGSDFSNDFGSDFEE